MLYKLKLDDLTFVSCETPLIGIPLCITTTGDEKIAILTRKQIITDDNIQKLSKSFIGHDIFTSNEFIYTDVHYHEYDEMRIIFDGYGIFYIPYDDYLYIMYTQPNDAIWIAPGVSHWFSSENIISLRLFKTKEYDTIPVHDEYLNYLHQQLKQQKLIINI